MQVKTRPLHFQGNEIPGVAPLTCSPSSSFSSLRQWRWTCVPWVTRSSSLQAGFSPLHHAPCSSMHIHSEVVVGPFLAPLPFRYWRVGEGHDFIKQIICPSVQPFISNLCRSFKLWRFYYFARNDSGKKTHFESCTDIIAWNSSSYNPSEFLPFPLPFSPGQWPPTLLSFGARADLLTFQFPQFPPFPCMCVCRRSLATWPCLRICRWRERREERRRGRMVKYLRTRPGVSRTVDAGFQQKIRKKNSACFFQCCLWKHVVDLFKNFFLRFRHQYNCWILILNFILLKSWINFPAPLFSCMQAGKKGKREA